MKTTLTLIIVAGLGFNLVSCGPMPATNNGAVHKPQAPKPSAANVHGDWSDEGDVTASRQGIRTNLELKQNGNRISGSLTYDAGARGSSGLVSIQGDIGGNHGSFTISNQRGHQVGTGSFIARGRSLEMNLNFTSPPLPRYHGTVWPNN